MRTGIFAIRDRVAQRIVSGLEVQAHVAAAVRGFTDALSDPRQYLSKHPADFELIQVGWLVEDEGELPRAEKLQFGEDAVVLTGSAWMATQEKAPSTEPNGSPDRVRALRSAGLVP